MQLELGQPDEGWKHFLGGAEVIYHLAWSTVPSEARAVPVEDARVNIIGSLSLIQAIQEVEPAARVVFASSGGTVYGALSTIPATEDHPLRPISAHGVSKLAVELYLEVARRRLGVFRRYRCASAIFMGPVKAVIACSAPSLSSPRARCPAGRSASSEMDQRHATMFSSTMSSSRFSSRAITTLPVPLTLGPGSDTRSTMSQRSSRPRPDRKSLSNGCLAEVSMCRCQFSTRLVPMLHLGGKRG